MYLKFRLINISIKIWYYCNINSYIRIYSYNVYIISTIYIYIYI